MKEARSDLRGWPSRVAALLGSAYPIMLGPMRLITLGEMAGAVSAAGAFGQIAASGLSADGLRAEIERARSLTERPVGVNIPVYRTNAFEALEIAIEMGVNTITTSAGNPSKIMGRAKEAGLKVLHKVSSVEMGKKAEAAGVDGLIAMGFEAGGHIGREGITTFCLIPQLVDTVRIPVVASGGIADARGVVAAFALGAEGVEMGTRFLATAESPAPAFFKERVISAGADATLVLGKDVLPIRVLKNRVTAQAARMDGAAGDETIASAGDGSYVQEGEDQESAVMPCGQIAGLIRSIVSVREVLMDIEQGAKAVSLHLRDLFHGSEGKL